MENYEIAKEANKIAYKILEQTKWLKNDTRFGYKTCAKDEAQNITELCIQLQSLIMPIRLPK